MAWSVEKGTNDIVITGFEKGIADSPETGIADIRSMNITSVPGEASVSFATAAGNTPPNQTGVSYTGSSGGGTFTVASTTGYYDGMAIKIASTSLGNNQINALIVAGGGGGGGGGADGAGAAGGGSGGQVISITGDTIGIGTYPVIVAVGGSGGNTSGTVGNDGNTSSFNGHTAAGGGGGGGGTGATSTPDAGAYGGGGGASGSVAGTGATGTVANAGGSGSSGSGTGPNAGGGGGGAGASGTNGVQNVGAGSATGGNGGNGVANSTSGASVTYGGGGGGGAHAPTTTTQGTGGTGGGGNGGSVNGTANTGGGGGGALQGSTAGGNGGSGIVIISYPTGTYTATGGTITTSGGRTIHTFTNTGTTNFVVSAINPQVGDVYYIGNLTSTTFKLYYDPTLSHVVSLISNPTGTFDIPIPTTPVATTTSGLNTAVSSAEDNLTFMIDSTGNVWFIPTVTLSYTGGTVALGSLQYAGNTNHSTTATSADFGIAVWCGYILVFINRSIDYISLANFFGAVIKSSTWTAGWKSNLLQTSYEHQTLVGTDGNLYICDGNSVSTLILVKGQSFDPTNSGTYTWNPQAILLNANGTSVDAATCMGQFQNYILIGGTGYYIYVYDKGLQSLVYPLICSDQYAYRIVGTNSNAYIFSGNRGRIYITNGQMVQLYKKVPDALSGNPEPYYTWQDAIYLRNKLYFTMTAKDNTGAALSTMGGIWCLGIDAGQTAISLPTAGSLYNCNQLSYGTYGGSAPALYFVPIDIFVSNTIPGFGVGAIWVNGGVTGIDIPTASPYTNFQSYVDSDLIPVGTFFRPETFQRTEYKLSKPLVSGESVKIYYRTNLQEAFTLYFTSTNTTVSDGTNKIPFQKIQWLQLRTAVASTATNPSYGRLTEVRMTKVV